MKLYLVLVFLSCALGGAFGAVKCKDDNGNDVDWFYFYKLPKNSSKSDPNVATGYAYSYVLSSGSSSSFKLSDLSLSSKDSMVGRTLAPIYATSRSDLIYVLYNDEKPNGSTTSSRGHTKVIFVNAGVLVADQDTGVWLVHSTPLYPPATSDGYSYPASGTTYGQTFLCISFATSVVNDIGTQFQYTIPYYYDTNMPTWSKTAAPALYDAVVNNVKVTASPWSHVADFKSSGGQAFKSFAKHTNYAKDLYFDLVAPDIKSDLNVETWNHGSDDLPSECSTYSVFNVQQVYNSAVGYSFKTSNDHSKWGAAPSNSADPWICVGDINRAASQEKRAGGTVCAINKRPWTAFSSSVNGTESCSTIYRKG